MLIWIILMILLMGKNYPEKKILNKIPWQKDIFEGTQIKIPTPGTNLDTSQSASSARTIRVWKAQYTKTVHARGADEPIRLSAPRMIFSTREIYTLLHPGGGRRLLITQGSCPTWVETSRRPPRLHRSFSRSPTRSSFTQMGWRYNPPSSPTGQDGPIYRLVPDPPSQPTRSPRPPPPTLPHQRPPGVAKNSNCAWPTDGKSATPRRPTKPGSDVTSAASSGESDGNSEYVESPDKLPTRSANTPELEDHILELKQIHEVA